MRSRSSKRRVSYGLESQLVEYHGGANRAVGTSSRHIGQIVVGIASINYQIESKSTACNDVYNDGVYGLRSG